MTAGAAAAPMPGAGAQPTAAGGRSVRPPSEHAPGRLVVLPEDAEGHALAAMLLSNLVSAVADTRQGTRTIRAREVCSDYGVMWVDLSEDDDVRRMQRLAAGAAKMTVAVASYDPEGLFRRAASHPALSRHRIVRL